MQFHFEEGMFSSGDILLDAYVNDLETAVAVRQPYPLLMPDRSWFDDDVPESKWSLEGVEFTASRRSDGRVSVRSSWLEMPANEVFEGGQVRSVQTISSDRRLISFETTIKDGRGEFVENWVLCDGEGREWFRP